MVKSFSEWLNEFKSSINEGYESNRINKFVSGRHYEVETRQRRIIKLSPARFEIRKPGQPRSTVNLSHRKVAPINVGFPINIKDWSKKPDECIGINSVMMDIGHYLADSEYYAITSNLILYAGECIDSEVKGQLSKNDICRAKDIGKTNDIHYDTIILNNKYVFELRKRDEIWEPAKIPTGLLPEINGESHFIGKIDGLNAYSTTFLEEKCVVFRRNDVRTYTTPIEVTFDSEPPESLIIEKWCSSAPIKDESVVVINMQLT